MSMTSNTLKPSYNPLLWAQLRPSMRPGVSDSSPSVTSIIPLLPENKTNTSLRVVLHDTKSALEQFSDRLGKLVDGVEHAKREIDRVSNSFTEGQDKVLEELNICVNRSQKGLLETLGSPAQATVLEEVKNSQGETNRRLALLEDKAELVQRQLQAISEQQGHILTSLATITPLAPLLKDSPHQQNQILFGLTSLLPLLPLLQSLPARIKASQEEVLGSATNCTAKLRCSLAVSSSQSPGGPEPCTPTPLTSDPLPGQCVNRRLPKLDAVGEQQQVTEDSSGGKEQSAPVPSRTLSSRTLPSYFADHSNSHIRQPVTTSDSMSSEPPHKPTADRDSRNSPLDKPPPPLDYEFSRNRKRPKLNANSQGKDIPLHKTTTRGRVTSRQTLSNITPHVQTRSGATAAKAPNKKNLSHPVIPTVSHGHSSTYRGPIATSHASDAFSSLQSTDPKRLLDVASPFDRIPASTLRSKHVRTTEPSDVDCFPSSTPPFARRGVPLKICTPPGAEPKIAEEISSSRKYLNRFDEHTPSANLSRKQLLRRKLFNEDADGDIEIDLDWGDIASN